ncbi:divergent PAP2 family protein [Candidatus Woesearchaeota archaeon]|nr:divergent PAP2 family protein [Candidatus Woesearchaeota archaeon]
MVSFFPELFRSRIFVSTVVAFLAANTLKIFSNWYKCRKIDVRVFFQNGGMPSSHTTTVTALTTAIYLETGVTPLFIATLLFSLIIISDAMGFRRAAGKQAEIINQIIEDIQKSKPFQTKKLYELLGHTPLQVFAGMILGVCISKIIYLFL